MLNPIYPSFGEGFTTLFRQFVFPGATFYVQLVSQPWLCGWPCRYIESPPHDKSGEDPKIGHAFSKPPTDLKANLPHTKEGSSNGGC